MHLAFDHFSSEGPAESVGRALAAVSHFKADRLAFREHFRGSLCHDSGDFHRADRALERI